MGFSKMNSLVVAVILAAMAASRVAEGQDIPSCASKLLPCADFLNATTKPPGSCCNPLKEAVTKEFPCLCNLYSSPGLLATYGINVTEAIRLPGLCGIPGDISACPGATAPTSSVPPPSGAPQNNAGRKASTAGMFSCLLIWVSMMLY